MHMHKDILIKISQFEGPLDLLLHLIKINEVDIYDIPIADITSQYVAYLKQMKEFNLDIATEFIVMAANLIRIKSDWLIPRKASNENQETDEVDDPRRELSEKLVEYQLYKEIAENFTSLREQRLPYHTGPARDLSKYQQSVPLLANEVDLNDLKQAIYRVVMKQVQRNPPQTTIETEPESIDDKIVAIRQTFVREHSSHLTFDQLISVVSRADVVNSLLAVLELMKQQEIMVYQPTSFGQIEIHLRKQDEVKVDAEL